MQAFQNLLSSKPYSTNISIFYFKYPWDFKINISIIKYYICMFTVSLMLVNGYMAFFFLFELLF